MLKGGGDEELILRLGGVKGGNDPVPVVKELGSKEVRVGGS